MRIAGWPPGSETEETNPAMTASGHSRRLLAMRCSESESRRLFCWDREASAALRSPRAAERRLLRALQMGSIYKRLLCASMRLQSVS